MPSSPQAVALISVTGGVLVGVKLEIAAGPAVGLHPSRARYHKPARPADLARVKRHWQAEYCNYHDKLSWLGPAESTAAPLRTVLAKRIRSPACGREGSVRCL